MVKAKTTDNSIIKIGINDGGISKEVYTDNKGVKYFYVQPHLLTQSHQLYFSGIMAQVGLGIDCEVLLDKLSSIEDSVLSITAANLEAKKKEIIKLTTNIETRVSQLIPVDLLIAATACVVFTEGEEFKIDLRGIQQKKLSILEDSDATSFFTHFALVTLINYNESSKTSVRDYLQAVQLEELIK